MTCFFIASCDYKFTGGEPISIFCLYRLHCGSYKTRISWCWNPLCLYSSDTSLPPPWTWGHPIWTQDQYQGNVASLSNIKIPKPSLQVTSMEICELLCAHIFWPLYNNKKMWSLVSKSTFWSIPKSPARKSSYSKEWEDFNLLLDSGDREQAKLSGGPGTVWRQNVHCGPRPLL